MNPHGQQPLSEQWTGRDSSAPQTYTPSLPPASRPPMAAPPTSHLVKLPASISTALLPPTERCHTHLKLLGSFHKLYVQISSSNGLFGYSDDLADEKGNNEETPIDWQSKRREKRWEVYVTRAVARFTSWWLSLPKTGYGAPVNVLSMNNGRERVAAAGMEGRLDGGLVINVDTMPPLGASREFRAIKGFY